MAIDNEEIDNDEIENEEAEDNDRGDDFVTDDEAEALQAVAKAADGGDEADDDEAGAGNGEDRSGQRIPYSRFKEVNDELKGEREARIRLEERLKALEQQQKAPQEQKQEAKPEDTPDIKALRRQLRAAILEGDDDKADEIEDKIDQVTSARLAQIKEEARRAALEAAEQRQEADRVEQVKREASAVAARIVAEYPSLDAKSDAANKEAIEDFVTIRDRELAKGASVKEAMETAMKRAVKLHDLAKRDAGKADEKAGTKPPDRKAAAVARNAEHERRIPPRVTGSSGAATSPDPDDMTDEEFEALPERERRRLRGDFVE
jgi:hypothetical protein